MGMGAPVIGPNPRPLGKTGGDIDQPRLVIDGHGGGDLFLAVDGMHPFQLGLDHLPFGLHAALLHRLQLEAEPFRDPAGQVPAAIGAAIGNQHRRHLRGIVPAAKLDPKIHALLRQRLLQVGIGGDDVMDRNGRRLGHHHLLPAAGQRHAGLQHKMRVAAAIVGMLLQLQAADRALPLQQHVPKMPHPVHVGLLGGQVPRGQHLAVIEGIAARLVQAAGGTGLAGFGGGRIAISGHCVSPRMSCSKMALGLNAFLVVPGDQQVRTVCNWPSVLPRPSGGGRLSGRIVSTPSSPCVEGANPGSATIRR